MMIIANKHSQVYYNTHQLLFYDRPNVYLQGIVVRNMYNILYVLISNFLSA